MIPKKAKRDDNEREIVDVLTGIGATVQRLSMADVPDLLVGFRGENFLLEVKMPKKKLRPGQFAFFDDWQGQCIVVRSPEEALQAIGAI